MYANVEADIFTFQSSKTDLKWKYFEQCLEYAFEAT